MARRKQVAAEVTAYHYNGASAQIATATDVLSLVVRLPGVDWVRKIDIFVDAKTGEVSVSIVPEAEEAVNSPRLRMRPDGSFEVRN